MLYAIIGRDVADSLSRRSATRPRHVDYLKRLVDEGRVVFAGPCPAIDSPDPGPAGFSGSLIIAEFDSLDAAHEWTTNDPYSVEGVFQHVEIKPVLRTFP